MAHNVNRIGLEPLPKVKAVYVPESQTLYIENVRLREDAEEMAENILVYPGLLRQRRRGVSGGALH